MEQNEIAERIAAPRPGAPGTAQVVEEEDPMRFMSSFAEALAAGGSIFLASPSWKSRERSELGRLIGGGSRGERGWLMIPSGGAGGELKFARHDGLTIAAAVNGFCGHYGMERVNSVSVLPLYHVSGFMAWMRSALTGGSFVPWSWKDAEAGRFPPLLPDNCCLSLVPTQLQRLLASAAAVAWLRRFRVIFLGGGPAWEKLVEEAARLELPLAPCYGATETAAMVAAMKPEQFLNGMRGCGIPLPHVRIDLVEGVVRITGESVYLGYYPGTRNERSWTTGDLGSFTPDGSLAIIGRCDNLIVTGGKKVSPAEVEEALRASGEFDDVVVIGIADPTWGQSVVACHPRGARPPGKRKIEEALSGLASYKHPKRYAAISPWPRNAQGKIDRVELARLASGT